MALKGKVWFVLGGLIFLGLAFSYQNFMLVKVAEYHLSAFPNICLSGSGTTCEVEVDWSVQNSPSVCLFRERDRKQIACGVNERVMVTTGLEGDSLSLRRGTSYNSSQIEMIHVGAIQVSDQVLNKIVRNQSRTTEPLIQTPDSFTASTWDGKIFFGYKTVTLQSGGAKSYITARVLRPSTFVNKRIDDMDFSKAHSTPFLMTADALTAQQQVELKSQLQNVVSGLENIDLNRGNFRLKDNMNVMPDPKFKENPYHSNLSGRPDPSGAYMTYRFEAIFGVLDLTLDGQRVRSDSYVNFLAKSKGYIVVASPDVNPRIVAGEIDPVEPMRDTTGKILSGHEASGTLDGRLIVWDGQPSIVRNGTTYQIKGYNNLVVYSYRPNPESESWSPPRPLTDMYYLDGPGRIGGETRIDGIPFSVHFPLAKYPITDDLGIAFGQGNPIPGSYLWINPDGSDVIFSSGFSYSGNQRRNTVLVGVRTRGKVRTIEGGMNLSRGINPNTDFTTPEDAALLTEAYANLPQPVYGNKRVAGGVQWNIMFSHLLVFPGSWNGLRDVKQSEFPLSNTDEAIGFFVSPTGRYAEVPLPKVAEDLLLWLPMNESFQYTRSAVEDYIITPSRATREATTRFRNRRTPDNSVYSHPVSMNALAEFPYEFYDVKKRWVEQKRLLDRYEGAQGNSVILSNGGKIDVTLSQPALRLVNRMKRYYVSLWVKPNELKATHFLSWNKMLRIELNNSRQLEVRHRNQDGNTELQVVNFSGAAGRWSHILVTRDLNKTQIYLDGVKVLTTRYAPDSFPVWPDFTHSAIVVGPSSIGRLNVDEVQIGTGYFTEDLVRQLARIKVDAQEWSQAAAGIAKGAYFTSRGLLARVPRDNPFTKEGVEIGRLLFNAKSLSSTQTVSCASCHVRSLSFADSRALSKGVKGVTSRNSPSLLNLAFMDRFFWDGSARTLESQVLHPFLHPDEMGMNPNNLVARVANMTEVSNRIKAHYNSPVSTTTISKALASFVRSLTTPDFKFDPSTLSPLEKRGWALFNGRGNCVACHSAPLFTDGKVHDIGLAQQRTVAGVYDLGAFRAQKDDKSRYAMKTPSLINVRDTAPYFHDGRMASLEEVVEFYNRGGDEASKNRTERSPFIHALDLDTRDKAALVAFLRSLTAPLP